MYKSQILTNYYPPVFQGLLSSTRRHAFFLRGRGGGCSCWSLHQAIIFHLREWNKLNRFFFQKDKQQLTCSRRTSSACLVSPGCVFVGTSVECCGHPSPAAWRGPPISFHQDAMKQGTRKTFSSSL